MKDAIRAFVVDTFFVDEFEDDESFLRAGILDSTGVLELVAFLEQEFEIRVADDELVPDNLDSLSAVVAYVERKRRSAA
jgi:acyl carrier protein